MERYCKYFKKFQLYFKEKIEFNYFGDFTSPLGV